MKNQLLNLKQALEESDLLIGKLLRSILELCSESFRLLHPKSSAEKEARLQKIITEFSDASFKLIGSGAIVGTSSKLTLHCSGGPTKNSNNSDEKSILLEKGTFTTRGKDGDKKDKPSERDQLFGSTPIHSDDNLLDRSYGQDYMTKHHLRDNFFLKDYSTKPQIEGYFSNTQGGDSSPTRIKRSLGPVEIISSMNFDNVLRGTEKKNSQTQTDNQKHSQAVQTSTTKANPPLSTTRPTPSKVSNSKQIRVLKNIVLADDPPSSSRSKIRSPCSISFFLKGEKIVTKRPEPNLYEVPKMSGNSESSLKSACAGKVAKKTNSPTDRDLRSSNDRRSAMATRMVSPRNADSRERDPLYPSKAEDIPRPSSEDKHDNSPARAFRQFSLKNIVNQIDNFDDESLHNPNVQTNLYLLQ